MRMKKTEVGHIIAAIILLTLVAGISDFFTKGLSSLPSYLGFSAIIILIAVLSKKIMANLLDSDVEHEIWQGDRFGFKPHHHFKTRLPYGILLPIIFSIFSLGSVKLMTLLTFEARALKYRASKRFGFYSYTEMTDWHTALIGTAGILGVLLLSFISYFPGLELLSKLAAFYAFANMIPLSKLDGNQIFFGSRPLYATLAVVTIIFFLYALFLI